MTKQKVLWVLKALFLAVALFMLSCGGDDDDGEITFNTTSLSLKIHTPLSLKSLWNDIEVVEAKIILQSGKIISNKSNFGGSTFQVEFPDTTLPAEEPVTLVLKANDQDGNLILYAQAKNVLPANNSTVDVVFGAPNQFGDYANLKYPIWAHTLTVLDQAHILIFGGSDGGNYRNGPFGNFAPPQLYDHMKGIVCVAGESGCLLPAFPISEGDDCKPYRAWHTATVTPDNKIVIIGGLGKDKELVSEVIIYDIASNEIQHAAAPVMARYGHTAVAYPDGYITVIGGFAPNETGTIVPQRSVVKFSLSDYSSKVEEDVLPNPLAFHQAIVVGSGDRSRVLITGGVTDENWTASQSVYLYDGTITQTLEADENSDLSFGRFFHRMISMREGNVPIIGGYHSTEHSAGEFGDVYIINTGKRGVIRKLLACDGGTCGTGNDVYLQGRFAPSATILGDNSIFVSGGSIIDSDGNEQTVFAPLILQITQSDDSDTQEMGVSFSSISAGTSGSSLPLTNTERVFSEATRLDDGTVLIIGGVDADGKSVSNVIGYMEPKK